MRFAAVMMMRNDMGEPIALVKENRALIAIASGEGKGVASIGEHERRLR